MMDIEALTYCLECDASVDADTHFDDYGNCEFSELREVLNENDNRVRELDEC